METINHLVMQCPFYGDNKNEMYTQLSNSMNEATKMVLNEPQHIFYFLMGSTRMVCPFEEMIDFWLTATKHINKIYIRALTGRD